MGFYEFDDYKKLVNSWIENQPKKGHGQLRQMAIYLGINSVIMSQVFRGKRELSMEQALGATRFMGLNELERDYFLLLVQKSRANSTDLRSLINKKIQDYRESAQALKNRIKTPIQMADENKAQFYSNWTYSAVRLGLSIPQLNSISTIANHLNLDRRTATDIIEFLIKYSLLIKTEDGYKLGTSITHIGHDSPFVKTHHNNWRLKSLQSMGNNLTQNLYYTGPMALSIEATKLIRNLILELIEKSTKIAVNTESETLQCLNIDWFSVGKNSMESQA